jgi:hypothetical protein
VNDIDIWGESAHDTKECFYCAAYYIPSDSSAPLDFRSTYCSQECYEKDTLEMKMAAEAEARFTSHPLTKAPTSIETEIPDIKNSEANKKAAEKAEFRMKVPPATPKGWDKV